MRMLDFVKFRYCPKCGEQNLQPNDAKSFVCLSCRFVYYHNPASVVIAIIEYDNKIILTKRASEPQKGLLALPGGFVDYEESLENALIREIQEELNLRITAPTYLCSHWERYLFRDIMYFSAISFYAVKVGSISNITANDDIDAYFLLQLDDVDYSKLAFESHRAALDQYRIINCFPTTATNI